MITPEPAPWVTYWPKKLLVATDSVEISTTLFFAFSTAFSTAFYVSVVPLTSLGIRYRRGELPGKMRL